MINDRFEFTADGGELKTADYVFWAMVGLLRLRSMLILLAMDSVPAEGDSD